MSADRLREAAGKIRETAEVVWIEGTELEWYTAPMIGGALEAAGFYVGSAEDASQMALWSPPVAVAVADWLDDYASWLDVFGASSRTPENTPALRLANAILGGAA